MGMDADIIGIGKFSKDIVKHLDYPENFYEDTPEGCEVIVTLFQCPTTDTSEALAEALDIHPWKFEEHKLDINMVVLDNLYFFAKEHLGMEEDFKDLEVLHKSRFEFYYRPNG